MGCCFVPDCHHKSEIHGCKMFRFPSSPKKRGEWKKLIRRQDRSPSKSARVCSCHFPDKNNLSLPKLFERNKAKAFLFSSPEKKTRCTSKLKQRLSCSPISMNWNVAGVLDRNSSDVCSVNQPIIEIESVPSVSETVTETEPINQPFVKSDVQLLQETIDNLRAVNNNLHVKLETVTSELKISKSQNLIMSSEIYFLQKQLEDSQKPAPFVISMISEKFCHFTGLANVEVFNLLLSMFENQEMTYYCGWNVQCLSKSDQLLMTLMKLRRNYSHSDLALRFNVSEGTVSNVTMTWIYALHEMLVEGLMAQIPSRLKNKASMPKVFSQYGGCRIVLDCTEVYTAVPKKLSSQNDMYSDYKHRITLKGLVGIAPNGCVTYVSKLFPGSSSDKVIVKSCGILDQLVAGDFVMADKGFLISDILPPGMTLNIPPFKSTPQFTPSQVASTFSIAQARIHIERAIRTGKIFSILQFIPGKYVPFASKIFQVCFALTNFKPALIREVQNQMLNV